MNMGTGVIYLKIVNIGILAHVDAGKTTVTEHLLHRAGVIREIGRVDSGNTQTDSMELERKRGISIKAATISMEWLNTKINILDTPGHVDFISEVERSISVLDGAVLVISAKEGIQSQTRVLFDVLQKLKIPTIIFINKLDRVGCDYQGLLKDIKDSLSKNILPLQRVAGEGFRDFNISAPLGEQISFNEAIDVISKLDDHLLELFIEGIDISKEVVEEKILKYVNLGDIYPILCGSALMGVGIDYLLDTVAKYFLQKNHGDFLSAVVFKIKRDMSSKQTYIRLFSGSIKVRDSINIANKGKEEKIKQIQLLKKGEIVEGNELCAGDIGIIYGPQGLQIGDIIGRQNDSLRKLSIAKPVLKTAVKALDPKDHSKLYTVLSLLAEEDPLLELEIGEINREIYLNLFGGIQMEILKSLLDESYGLKVDFSDATTIYKETPLGIGTAFTKMWDSENHNPYAAAVGIRIEPAPRGSGLQYISEVSTGDLLQTFQNAVEEAVYETAKQGLMGWEVTDIKVTFTQGEFNSVDSCPSDFRNLTPMVFMDALNNAKTKLLEPFYTFELKVPNAVAGRAIGDLQKMKATFENPLMTEHEIIIKGLIPVDTCKEYPLTLASYTEGKGVFSTRFFGYKEDTQGVEKIRENLMVDPLNKKMYLMYKMNTIRG